MSDGEKAPRRPGREQITTSMELLGAGLVVTGVALFSAAAAFVVAGLVLIGVGYLQRGGEQQP